VLCDTLLKGPEVELPPGYNFTDKESTVRTKMRLKWWLSAKSGTYHELCMPQSETIPHLPIPEAVESLCLGYAPSAPPVFFGHYWLPFHGELRPIASNMACLDFSVAKDGALVAYRWDGEQTLAADKLVFVKAQK
jgi:hypothetical protein